ncbi:MAG: fibronectin/fibrinogen-binding protein [Ruminococcaceae bacterium]|nr:fibronectin/fibrinogen-binding protein [Oscillospiraceae bacterium]
MAFDAGMVSFVTREINEKLKDGKVEKIYQPQKDEIIVAVRCGGANHRLLINVGSSNSRINITSMKPDNPANPPMFCMMLRKHFQGAKLVCAEQLGFERAVRLTFDAYDELGFISHKHMIVEIMGTYSNLILTDKDDKILGAAKIIDMLTSQKRQVIPGMIYEMPPAQNKIDPLEITEKEFLNVAANADPDIKGEKFIISSFIGISPVVAREIVYRCTGNSSSSLGECEKNLCTEFFGVMQKIKGGNGIPALVFSDNCKPIEYSFVEIHQYGTGTEVVTFETFGELIDKFFFTRANNERVAHRASDVQRILTNAEKRLSKKITILAEELASCDEGEKYRLYGDLITANIYRLKKGDDKATLENYYDEMKPVTITLDTRLTPAQNAQRYYKKYTKSKSAKEHLAKQIEIANREYEYIYTVFDSLSRAETEKEISEIRTELYHSGFASRMKGFSEKKKQTPSYIKYRTSGGYTVLCGKNNLANEYITFKLAEKEDWWFHVKNQPGSHVVMQCPKGEEPSEFDFTEAATIAACNSKASEGAAVDVDYTKIRFVKKPPAAKPGYVIYHTNYSARVAPDAELAAALKIK